VASFGPNSRKSTVAPASGLTRPDTVAWSVSAPPITTPADATVSMVGVAPETMVVSLVASHRPATAALLASPL